MVLYCGTGSGYSSNVIQPGDPSNPLGISATPVLGGIRIEWDYSASNPEAVAYTVLYRSAINDELLKTNLAVVTGNTYFDQITAAEENGAEAYLPETWYYWVEVHSVIGTRGELIGPAVATTIPTTTQMIQLLSGQINSSLLSSSLNSTINQITVTATDLVDEIDRRSSYEIATASLLSAVSDENAAVTAVIASEATTRAAQYEAVATSVNTLQSSYNGQFSSIEVLQNTVAGEDGLTAQYSVKLDVDGNVAGFGLYSEAYDATATSTFIVNADRFAITHPGGSADNSIVPFIVDDGAVYINSAVIADATIVAAMITDGNITEGKIANASITNAKIKDKISSTDWDDELKTGWQIDKAGVVQASGIGIYIPGYYNGDGVLVPPTPLIESGVLGDSIANTSQEWADISGTGLPEDSATRNAYRGLHNDALDYVLGDMVSFNDQIYICILVHLGTDTDTDPTGTNIPNTYWDIFSQRGAAGITITNTATTNGVTVVTFSDASEIIINDGTPGVAGSVKIAYASGTNGQDKSFTQGTLKFIKYVESTGAAVNDISDSVYAGGYVRFIGEDGDPAVNSGVVAVYSKDGSGVVGQTSFAHNDDQVWVSFVEWVDDVPALSDALVTAATFVRFVGTDGTVSNARSVSLTSPKQAITYAADGTTPVPSAAFTITATPVNVVGVAKYTFKVNGVSVQASSTSATYAYTPPNAHSDLPVIVTVELTEDNNAAILDTDTFTIFGLKPGVQGESGFSSAQWVDRAQGSRSATRDNISYDATENALVLKSDTDGSLAVVFPAFKVQENQTYKIRFSYKTVADIDGETGSGGLYLRMIQDNVALPSDKIYLETTQDASLPDVKGLSNNPGVPGYTQIIANASVIDSWTTVEYDYVVPAGAVVVSAQILNWSDLGTRPLLIKNLEITKEVESALTIVLANEAHAIPANDTGVVSSYANSGTEIRVYEGVNELDYDGVGSAKSHYTISAVPTGIALGSAITGSGANAALVSEHTNMTTDVASVTYTITGKRASGVAFSITKEQTLTKVRAGVEGTSVLLSATETANGVTTVTFNDGQSIIINDGADGVDAVDPSIFSWKGANFFQTNTNYAGGDKLTFTSAISGKCLIKVKARDAEGDIHVGLNSVDLGTMSGPDEVTQFYAFTATNLIAGANEISIWSSSNDGGVFYEVHVFSLPADGAMPELGVDYFAPTPGVNGTSVKLQYSVDGSSSWQDAFTVGDLYVRSGTKAGNAASYTYGAAAKFVPEKGIEYSDGNPGVSAYLHLAYGTSDAGANFNQSPAGATYIGSYTDDEITDSATAADYTWAKIRGDNGTSSSLIIAYAENVSGLNASFTPSVNLKFIKYYEYTGVAPTIGDDVFDSGFVKYIGDNGDTPTDSGVIAIYATSVAGDNASFSYVAGHEFVNFYEWSGSVPVSIPSALTYVKYVGSKGDTGDGGALGGQLDWQLDGMEVNDQGQLRKTFVENTPPTPPTPPAWDSQAYSTVGYQGACYMSFRSLTINKSIMVGLTTDPADGASYNKIDFVFYLRWDGNLSIFENGFWVMNPERAHLADIEDQRIWLENRSVNDIFTIAYDNSVVRYYMNETLLHTTITAPDQTLYVDSSQHSTGYAYTFDSVMFAPTGNVGVRGPDGNSLYTWIKYGDDASGTGLADLPTGKFWIGLAYNKSTANESTNAADYTWSLIQGPKGDPGTVVHGTSMYFHVAYATSATGDDFSTTSATDATYIGTYTDETEADASEDSESWNWSLIKGPEGPRGYRGFSVQGDSAYFHTAWATSADGSVNFNTSIFANATYLGTYADTTETDSTTYSDYSWVLVKGAQGDPVYTWIKYADDNVGTGLNDSPIGKPYIGLAYNKTTDAESNTPGDYTWSLIQGVKGDTGDIPTVADIGGGSYTITGQNGSITISDGGNAPIPTVLDNGNGTVTVNDGADNTVLISDGVTPEFNVDYFNGNDGSYISYVYKNVTIGSAAPNTPTGGAFNGTTETVPFGWADIAYFETGKITYRSETKYSVNFGNWSNSGWSTVTEFIIQGDQGDQGSDAGSIAWTTSSSDALGGVIVDDNGVITKSGTNGWNAQAYSDYSYEKGCYVKFKTKRIAGSYMLGLNADPSSNLSYEGIDHCWYINGEQGKIFENSSPLRSPVTNSQVFVTVAVDDTFAVAYKDNKIYYYHNDVLIHTTETVVNLVFFVDSSFYTVSSTAIVDNVVFDRTPPFIGQITPENKTTYIAKLTVDTLEIADNSIFVPQVITTIGQSEQRVRELNGNTVEWDIGTTASLDFSDAHESTSFAIQFTFDVFGKAYGYRSPGM